MKAPAKFLLTYLNTCQRLESKLFVVAKTTGDAFISDEMFKAFPINVRKKRSAEDDDDDDDDDDAIISAERAENIKTELSYWLSTATPGCVFQFSCGLQPADDQPQYMVTYLTPNLQAPVKQLTAEIKFEVKEFSAEVKRR